MMSGKYCSIVEPVCKVQHKVESAMHNVQCIQCAIHSASLIGLSESVTLQTKEVRNGVEQDLNRI